MYLAVQEIRALWRDPWRMVVRTPGMEDGEMQLIAADGYAYPDIALLSMQIPVLSAPRPRPNR